MIVLDDNFKSVGHPACLQDLAAGYEGCSRHKDIIEEDDLIGGRLGAELVLVDVRASGHDRIQALPVLRPLTSASRTVPDRSNPTGISHFWPCHTKRR